MDRLCFVVSCVFMLSRLFYAALWSPAGKGLTSWLLLVMFIVFWYFPMWYPVSAVVIFLTLDRKNEFKPPLPCDFGYCLF